MAEVPRDSNPFNVSDFLHEQEAEISYDTSGKKVDKGDIMTRLKIQGKAGGGVQYIAARVESVAKKGRLASLDYAFRKSMTSRWVEIDLEKGGGKALLSVNSIAKRLHISKEEVIAAAKGETLKSLLTTQGAEAASAIKHYAEIVANFKPPSRFRDSATLITKRNEQTPLFKKELMDTIKVVLSHSEKLTQGVIVQTAANFSVEEGETRQVYYTAKMENGSLKMHYFNEYLGSGSFGMIFGGVSSGGELIALKNPTPKDSINKARAETELENERQGRIRLAKKFGGEVMGCPALIGEGLIFDSVKREFSVVIGKKSDQETRTQVKEEEEQEVGAEIVEQEGPGEDVEGLVMKREAGNLGAVTKDGATAPMPQEDRMLAAHQILSGLKEFASKGIAHCDRKAENLLNTYEDGVPVVRMCDLGSILFKEDHGFPENDVGNVLGSPQGISPEYRGELERLTSIHDYLKRENIDEGTRLTEFKKHFVSGVDHISDLDSAKKYIAEKRFELEQQKDVYAAGVTLFETFVGKLPLILAETNKEFEEGLQKYWQKKDKVKSVLTSRGVKEEVADLILEMLEADPKKRIAPQKAFTEFESIVQNNKKHMQKIEKIKAFMKKLPTEQVAE